MTTAPLLLDFALAAEGDAPELQAMRVDVARALTARYGKGPWSTEPSLRGVVAGFRHAQVWLALEPPGALVGSYRVTTRKPWAIDASYFTECDRALYLTDMSVRPDRQRQGVGRACLQHAAVVARAWPAGAIRLDAYDDAAGAGVFYARCGFIERGRVVYRTTPLRYYERLIEV
jgi:GNAT superfamily N-acetyltransferase